MNQKFGIILVVLVILVAAALYAVNNTKEESNPVTLPTQSSADEQEQRQTQEATQPADNIQNLDIDARSGDAPDVTEGIPHIQQSQTSNDEVYDELVRRVYETEGITGGESQSSLPGALSIALAENLSINRDAVINGREFAHIHASPGRGSLHLVLSKADSAMVVEQGWGVYHPFALNGQIPGIVMVFAPRDALEVETVDSIVEASLNFAQLQ